MAKSVSEIRYQFHQLGLQSKSEMSPNATTQAAEDHAIKNRDQSFVPFDHNRVTIADQQDDYINASFIKGEGNRVDYIASQGPTDRTAGDHWLMIWQQDIKVIVMLTKCEESGVERCSRYWPECLGKPMRVGRFNIQLNHRIQQRDYIERQLQVQPAGVSGSRAKIIMHYQFLDWPQNHAPSFSAWLLFYSIVKTELHSVGYRPPVLVHCSRGGGRTGAFIALDLVMRRLPRILIYDTVLQLRQCRQGMVQVWRQYAMLYEYLAHYLDHINPGMYAEIAAAANEEEEEQEEHTKLVD